MARLFGIIGNRPDLTARVLAFESEALRARSKGEPLGWGLGFYQGGEVLIRRRPLDERPELDIASLAADVRADLLIGHVRHATVGALRTENTHPFRYRQWLFAQTGTVPAFERVRDRLVESVPEFLRGGIRGETDADGMTAELGAEAGELNIMISNGELVVAVHRSPATMRMRVLSGAVDADV